MPRWVVGAITFNNTSAFPLLLVQSLATTGVLAPLLAGPNDTESDALDRAKSYFLISAVVSNTMTFGAGPSQLKGHEEDAPNQAPNVHWQDEAHSGNQDDPEDQTQGDGQRTKHQTREATVRHCFQTTSITKYIASATASAVSVDAWFAAYRSR